MTCDALRYSDEMHCYTCDLRWDVNDPEPPECNRPKRRLIGICGPAGAGKSTMAEHLFERHGFTRLSFADPLKTMILVMLYETGVDYPGEAGRLIYGDLKATPHEKLNGHSARHAMQTLGTEWGRDCMGEDFWANIAKRKIDRLPDDINIVLDDVRYENEAAMIRSLGGKIVKVHGRGGIGTEHRSEKGVQHDMAYENTGTVKELEGWTDYVLPLVKPRAHFK